MLQVIGAIGPTSQVLDQIREVAEFLISMTRLIDMTRINRIGDTGCHDRSGGCVVQARSSC
jgi:hypothetical protein